MAFMGEERLTYLANIGGVLWAGAFGILAFENWVRKGSPETPHLYNVSYGQWKNVDSGYVNMDYLFSMTEEDADKEQELIYR